MHAVELFVQNVSGDVIVEEPTDDSILLVTNLVVDGHDLTYSSLNQRYFDSLECELRFNVRGFFELWIKDLDPQARELFADPERYLEGTDAQWLALPVGTLQVTPALVAA